MVGSLKRKKWYKSSKSWKSQNWDLFDFSSIRVLVCFTTSFKYLFEPIEKILVYFTTSFRFV